MAPALEQLTKEQLAEKYEAVQFENYQLKEKLEWFKRQIFGKKSERFIPVDKNQLSLEFGELSSGSKEEEPRTETITYDRKKKKERKEKPVRTSLPAHLRREEIRITPEGDLSGMVKIGEEISEYLQEKPGDVYVLKLIRDVYAYKNDPDKGILTPELPSHVLPKFSVGVGMLAMILVRKYVDHLPIYRQIQIYKRHGITLSPSTLHGWIKAGANMLIPLYNKARELLLAGNYIQSDDTRFKVLEEKGDRQTLLGYMWVYQDPTTGMVVFDYSSNHDRSKPEAMLENFIGYLQCDGAPLYESFEKSGRIILLNCWAHARRKFDEAKGNDKQRAEAMLFMIQKLYAIERIAKENLYSPEQRFAIRQEQSLPVLAEIKSWLIENYSHIAPSSAIGKAISYTLPRIENLSHYCSNGILEIDNNLAENSIRPIVLGRKNYLFAATHESAQRAAVIYSMFATCKRNGINPEAWLTDVLGRINDHHINRMEELLPQNWKPLPAPDSTPAG